MEVRLSKLENSSAQNEVRVKKNSKDIDDIWEMLRTVPIKIQDTSMSQVKSCSSTTEKLDTKISGQMSKYFMYAISVVIFVFGYFYLDLASHKENEGIISNKILIEIQKVRDDQQVIKENQVELKTKVSMYREDLQNLKARSKK